MSVKANGRYMTWWNAKRINNRIKYTELVELLGLKQSQMGQLSQYFIGKTMPGEDMIRKIADLFDVSYDEAHSHFFNDWGGNKSKNQVKTFSAPDDIFESPDKDPEIRKETFKMSKYPRTKYMTWWNKKRMEQNVTYQELSELLNLSGSKAHNISKYFIGDHLAPDEIIQKICDIFDVPFEEGKKHFLEDLRNRKGQDDRYTARGHYKTWWNEKRVKANVSYKNIIERMDTKHSQAHIVNCFIGKSMPSDYLITKICDIFDVPFDEGKSHFFNDWDGHNSKNRLVEQIRPEENPEIKFDIFVGNTPTEEGEKEVDDAMDNYNMGMFDRESILKKVYGNVDFDTYLIIDEALLVGSSNDILKNIYGKIPFDAYQEVLKCL